MADLPVADDFISSSTTEAAFKAALKILVENVASKDWVNANPLFKPITIVAGDNFNNFTQSGLYVLPVNLLDAQITNAPIHSNGYAMAGVLVVAKVNSTVSTQTYYPYLSQFKPTYRSFIDANGAGFDAWDSFLFESTKTNRKDLTTGQDVLTLAAGRYKIPSLVVGNTFLNMPVAPYKYGIIDVDIVGSAKIIRFAPYGRDLNFYTNASYDGGLWADWQTFSPVSVLNTLFASPASVTASTSALADAVTNSDYYGKKYSASEQNGTAFYVIGTIAGYNSIHTKPVTFNALNGRIFNATSGQVEYRIYTGAKAASTANGYGVFGQPTISSPDFSGVCSSFPKSDNLSAQNVVFDKVITIAANVPFVIAFKAVDGTKFSIAYSSAVTGNLESRSYNLSQMVGDWSAQTAIGNATLASGYVQSGFKLIVSVPQTGGVTPEPKYLPTLVLPPKIYVLANLQAHIYPEHLLVEDHAIYNHDITCLRGNQMRRGWVYDVPTTQAAGNIVLTYAVHDKQTGALLNSASTTLVVADQTKSGTKNVLVIGDSYVNAGTITQRLLDISATDVLKTTLIGTRGTGTNKHEGRGGWRVSDYATVGRNDYKFTVSGVTTAPAINSTVYSFDGRSYMVQEVSLSAGAGYFVASLYSGSAPTTLGISGTLTKSAGVGDATVAFSNIEGVTANPFWFSGAINFGQYLSTNSLSTPDIVLIQLGVNDCFNSTTDADVESIAATAFAQLDTLITSIKASNAAVRIGIVAPPTYANQDAFGINYACNQTAWRAKRNIVTWNKKMYAYFAGKEAQNVYVVAAGLNVDTESNFPTTTQATNSQNATVITVQNNGVHPDTSGYKQIGDAMFAFLKAI